MNSVGNWIREHPYATAGLICFGVAATASDVAVAAFTSQCKGCCFGCKEVQVIFGWWARSPLRILCAAACGSLIASALNRQPRVASADANADTTPS